MKTSFSISAYIDKRGHTVRAFDGDQTSYTEHFVVELTVNGVAFRTECADFQRAQELALRTAHALGFPAAKPGPSAYVWQAP